MCLIVYLGSTHPFDTAMPPIADGFPAVRDADIRPDSLRDFEHIAVVATVHNGMTGCSCVFHENSVSWERREEEPETEEAFSILRNVVDRHFSLGARIIVFASWSGSEHDPAVLHWRLSPTDLRPGFSLFQGGEFVEGGIPPDTYLMEFDYNLAEPVFQVVHV